MSDRPTSFHDFNWACGHTGPGYCKICRDLQAEERDSLKERLADVEGALYLAFLEQGCRPDEAKDYMLMAVGYQEGRAALDGDRPDTDD